MAQVTDGIRAVLSNPIVYSIFQFMMGGRKPREEFVANYIRPEIGMKILDVGCGPAGILNYFPKVDYWGFDVSDAYICQAKTKYAGRGHFLCKQLQVEDLAGLPKFDVVLALGLLHHLDDPVAIDVMRLARDALRPGGRLVTIDPCLDSSQNYFARILVRNDRGQNVRDKRGYEELARQVFSSLRAEVRHQTWIPYTHCFMECEK